MALMLQRRELLQRCSSEKGYGESLEERSWGRESRSICLEEERSWKALRKKVYCSPKRIVEKKKKVVVR
jgi:hypothetical protein